MRSLLTLLHLKACSLKSQLTQVFSVPCSLILISDIFMNKEFVDISTIFVDKHYYAYL